MHLKTLKEWIEWIQPLHQLDMDFSLERVSKVSEQLGLINSSPTVITVGGTNGKGSCVAGLEAIYLRAGFRVGAFTSPILFRHNEYIRIQGKEVTDALFCNAFEKINEVRGNITLTPFEFNTLAAFYIFKIAKLHVWILEVGLGGRFDAVNIIDANVAVISSIGIDHVEWLGDTREQIALEKAGIFRKNCPAVCGDFDPPNSLINYAKEIKAPFFLQGKDFYFEKKMTSWNWISNKKRIENLPLPHLMLENMSTVLMVIELLQKKLPISDSVIRLALENLALPGRHQKIFNKTMHIFDVAHNPAAVSVLAKKLQEETIPGKTYAIFSMLSDKDIVTTLENIEEKIDEWHIAPLNVKRGASLLELEQKFLAAKIKNFVSYSSIEKAYEILFQKTNANDRIVIFGSFHTVSKVLGYFKSAGVSRHIMNS